MAGFEMLEGFFRFCGVGVCGKCPGAGTEGREGMVFCGAGLLLDVAGFCGCEVFFGKLLS